MLQATVIGNVGADAQVNNKDGREFVTFRVAHNDSWTDAAGTQHSSVVWVDCIMNGKPKVAEFIKQGTQLVVIGTVRLRVYSSQKDRCMKAGMTIHVDSVQLLGGANDDVPRRLYDDQGVQHDIKKWYLTDVKGVQLTSMRGDRYQVDGNGWVSPILPEGADAAQSAANNEPERESNGDAVQVY